MDEVAWWRVLKDGSEGTESGTEGGVVRFLGVSAIIIFDLSRVIICCRYRSGRVCAVCVVALSGFKVATLGLSHCCGICYKKVRDPSSFRSMLA